MNRPILVCALMFMATAALGAQETSHAGQSNPYQGISTPPPDDTIVTTSTPKPAAGRPIASPVVSPAQNQDSAPVQFQPTSTNSTVSSADPDGGIVAVQQKAPAPAEPTLTARSRIADPDGDIVHPRPAQPGTLQEGTTIRVELLDRLSTANTERGEAFRGRVASDVLQGDQVLIPAGTEIDGRVADVSSGHPGGRGSMRLQPETVILPDGRRYRLSAEVTGAPGSKEHIGGEGEILPDSRLKRDGIEYGGAVGAGVTTGAIVGGLVGALTGGLIGAGLVTAHLLISHPQATLDPGTVLLFTLTEPLMMTPPVGSGN